MQMQNALTVRRLVGLLGRFAWSHVCFGSAAKS